MKTDEDYARRLSVCMSLDDLRVLLADYAELAVDAAAIVASMTTDDFATFARGLKLERRGRFAGEDFARRFAAVMMPLPMLRITQIADEYKVPFHVALSRVREVRPDLLKVEV